MNSILYKQQLRISEAQKTQQLHHALSQITGIPTKDFLQGSTEFERRFLGGSKPPRTNPETAPTGMAEVGQQVLTTTVVYTLKEKRTGKRWTITQKTYQGQRFAVSTTWEPA